MVCGAGRDAEVDLLTVDRELDATVLRHPLLGDVDPRHQLQTGKQRLLIPLGKLIADMTDTIDAVSENHPILARLEMDIARSSPDRLDDHLVRESHDAGVGGVLIDRRVDRRVHRLVHRLVERDVDRGGRHPLVQIRTTVAGDEVGHVRGDADHDLEVLRQSELEHRDRFEISGVGHHDSKLSTVAGEERKDAELLDHIGVDERHVDLVRPVGGIDVDEFTPLLGRQSLADLDLRRESSIDQRFTEALAALGGRSGGLGDGVLGDRPLLDQDLAELLANLPGQIETPVFSTGVTGARRRASK